MEYGWIRLLFNFLLAAILFVAIAYLFTSPIKSFVRNRKYRQILTAVHTCFQDVDAFSISKNARSNSVSEDLYYGEVNLCALLDLMALVKPKPQEVFYDLGAGCGKTMMAVKLKYPFLQVKGIELIEDLYTIAVQKLPLDFTLICGDYLNQNFLDADILFINATGFSCATWDKLVTTLMQLKSGTRIILTSKTLPCPPFVKKTQGLERMSWGYASTTIYEKS